MTNYRISADWLEYSLNDGNEWFPVLCQNGLINKENHLYSCYRGCSAFEETTESIFLQGEPGIAIKKMKPVVSLSCGCGRTIKLEEER
jgi:hypothetical protein